MLLLALTTLCCAMLPMLCCALLASSPMSACVPPPPLPAFVSLSVVALLSMWPSSRGHSDTEDTMEEGSGDRRGMGELKQ
jgi:hypothetical protein